MQPTQSSAAVKRVLILISGITNYFYDVVGERLSETFRILGWQSVLQSVPNYQPADYDLVIFTNINDIIGSYAKLHNLDWDKTQFTPAAEFVKAVKSRAKHAVVILMEPVHSRWFSYACYWCHRTGVLELYDLGFHDQRKDIPLELNGINYYFMLSGLNTLERKVARAWQYSHVPRPLPWTFIGLVNRERLSFVQELATRYMPNGFVYMPKLDHVSRDGQHIDDKRLQTILEATRYYVWVSQEQEHFYMESERFRNAALAGCVPIKVQQAQQLILPDEMPFTRFVLPWQSFEKTLQTADYETLRQAFLEEYLSLPTLESEISRVMLSRLG